MRSYLNNGISISINYTMFCWGMKARESCKASGALLIYGFPPPTHCHSNFRTVGGRIRSLTLLNHPKEEFCVSPLKVSISLSDTTWIPFAKCVATLQVHSYTHTDEWQICEEEAKASVMDRREGCCSNPASSLLYLSQWPVVVASRPCCVHGGWPDLISDCLAVSGELEGWGFSTWHLSNSGGVVHRKAHYGLSGPWLLTGIVGKQTSVQNEHHHSLMFVTYRQAFTSALWATQISPKRSLDAQMNHFFLKRGVI